ncbi:MAG TPA: flavodoxin family protein [Spirochaetes bacterium]|nr:flavodoxin family protein [Spirochaetota bacterium]
MKVFAVNGSPRKNGNTAIMIGYVFKELEKEGIECEMIQMSGKSLQGCIACYKCFENKNRKCSVNRDDVNELIAKMAGADGIILGSPTYFADLTANMKALIERAGLVSKANNEMFRRKVGAAVVTARRGGASHVFNSINQFFLSGQMVVAGSSYWNMGFGRDIGEVEKDDEGKNTMTTLGENMAWLLKKLNG